MDKKILVTGAAVAAGALVPGAAIAGPAVAAIVAALAKSQDEMKAAEAQGLVSLEDETRKQHLLMEYQSHQARVAQEVAIAHRIETSEVVEIEEFYDQSGELGGEIGGSLKAHSLKIGARGARQQVVKRIYKFKGSTASIVMASADYNDKEGGVG